MIRRLNPATCLYLAAFVAATAAMAVFADGYAWRIYGLVGLQATAAIGFQLVFGRLGLLMLAQGAFFGIGAYAAGMASVHLGLNPWLCVGMAVAAGAVAAVLTAGPVARLESHYVALATLALSQLALLAVTHGGTWTGGSNGLYGVAPLGIAGLELIDGPSLATVSWLAVGLALLVAYRLGEGANKARHATVRDAPLVAASLGIDARSARLILFPAAGALAALAGALQAHGLGVVSPAVMRFEVMITVLAIAVVGGRGSPLGAVAAAALLVPLPELFRWLEGYYLVAYGGVLLAVITLAPRGIDGTVRRLMPDLPGEEPASGHGLDLKGGVLRVEGLSKAFGGNRALEGCDLEVAPGGILGLIGPNGSGKTTALNLISGIERADTGRVLLDGADVTALGAVGRARAGIARAFQHPVFPEELTALEAASAGASSREIAFEALRLVGLAERWATSARDLGVGEARLLDLARALATQPRVLMLDEPAAGLSDAEREGLARVLTELRDRGLAIVLVEHRMDFLMRLSDRVLCLVAGRPVAEGDPAYVRAHPVVQEAYLGVGHASERFGGRP